MTIRSTGDYHCTSSFSVTLLEAIKKNDNRIVEAYLIPSTLTDDITNRIYDALAWPNLSMESTMRHVNRAKTTVWDGQYYQQISVSMDVRSCVHNSDNTSAGNLVSLCLPFWERFGDFPDWMFRSMVAVWSTHLLPSRTGPCSLFWFHTTIYIVIV